MSPSMDTCENANKEIAGVLRHIRAFLERKTKVVINVQHPLAAFLIRHAGWLISRFEIRADGRTGFQRLKGHDYRGLVAGFGECVWSKLPQQYTLGKLDERWLSVVWLGKSERSDEHIVGGVHGINVGRSVRRKIEDKRWSRKAIDCVVGTP